MRGRLAWRGCRGSACHAVVPLLGFCHVGRVLGAGEAGRAYGGGEAGVGEHVHAPLRAAEPVVLADGGHQVGAVVQCGVADGPRAGVDVGVFDADAGDVGVPVVRLPCGVGIPYELSDAAIRVDLIVGAGFAGLPQVVAVGDTQIAGVVMDDDLVDVTAGTSGRVMSVHKKVLVRFKRVPVLHDCSCRLVGFYEASHNSRSSSSASDSRSPPSVDSAATMTTASTANRRMAASRSRIGGFMAIPPGGPV